MTEIGHTLYYSAQLQHGSSFFTLEKAVDKTSDNGQSINQLVEQLKCNYQLFW